MPNGTGIIENHALFGPFIANIDNYQNVDFQALGPSESEPPSKTMSDGMGFVENGAFFGPFIANT